MGGNLRRFAICLVIAVAASLIISVSLASANPNKMPDFAKVWNNFTQGEKEDAAYFLISGWAAGYLYFSEDLAGRPSDFGVKPIEPIKSSNRFLEHLHLSTTKEIEYMDETLTFPILALAMDEFYKVPENKPIPPNEALLFITSCARGNYLIHAMAQWNILFIYRAFGIKANPADIIKIPFLKCYTDRKASNK